MRRESVQVFQDGNRFYADRDTASYMAGVVIFQSSIVVSDFNLSAARLARKEFVAWAERNNLTVEFV